MSCGELTPPVVAQIPDALRVPLDSLHADAGYLIGRVLDKSLTADDVVSIIRSRIDEARAALAAPAHPATAGDAEDAARYRWLRQGDNDELVIQHGPVAHDYHWLPRLERLDAMIDAAMRASKGDCE